MFSLDKDYFYKNFLERKTFHPREIIYHSISVTF